MMNKPNKYKIPYFTSSSNSTSIVK
jgi:hypothetical protein